MDFTVQRSIGSQMNAGNNSAVRCVAVWYGEQEDGKHKIKTVPVEYVGAVYDPNFYHIQRLEQHDFESCNSSNHCKPRRNSKENFDLSRIYPQLPDQLWLQLV